MLKRSSTTPLLLFVAGMAAGWVAKQLYESPEVRERTKSMVMTATELRNRLADSDEAERVREIFGKVSQDATQMYQDLQESLVEELESLQISLNELDKQKYLAIVADIIAGFREEQALPEEQVKKLTRALTNDWQKLSQERDRSRTGRRKLAARNTEE